MNRRNFLTAAGATLILPKLESFADKKDKSVHPKMVFLGMGYGFTNTFYPDTFGKDYKLTKLLQPLARHKNNFTMINNLWHKFSQDPHGGCTSYLTGANVDGTPGKPFANTISCDQVAAKYLGKDTRYSSIQLSGEGSNGVSG